ncbi:MAG: HAMP domain-containing histidine kinase [Thermoflexales bacterium]|nr:HAMP domain-containing histidine kinase [Thermoflexales bacterium]
MRTNTRRSLGFALTLAGVVAVSVGLVGIVLRPTSADAPLFALLFAIPIVVSSAGAAIALRQSWWRQFTHLAMALFVTYAVGAGLILLTIAATANLMFLSDHDALLVLVIMIYATGVMLVFSYFVASSLSAGITDVTRAADAVRGGDLAARASESGRDEISRLARAFNEMTARLALAREQEDQLNHMRRDLIAWVSHDLRTPLTSIRARVEALADGVVRDDEVPRYLASIRADTLALNRLIDDLFDLATADAGGLTLDLMPCEIGDLVSDTVRAMSVVAEQRGVALAGVVPEDMQPVSVSPPRIQRVLNNLIGNALAHTPAGGRIDITAERIDRNIVVSVSDTGEGISPQDLPRVFDRFYRGEQSRKRSDLGGGTGLGLAISRALVEAHHGTISITSALGKGTTVRFSLPQLGPAESVSGER